MNRSMKNLMMIFISVIMIIPASTMIMPVSATYHSSSDTGAQTYGLNYGQPYSWVEPWVGVPRYLCGSWEIHGTIYSSEGSFRYTASDSTWNSAWRRMYGWTRSTPYLTGYSIQGGWYS